MPIPPPSLPRIPFSDASNRMSSTAQSAVAVARAGDDMNLVSDGCKELESCAASAISDTTATKDDLRKVIQIMQASLPAVAALAKDSGSRVASNAPQAKGVTATGTKYVPLSKFQ
jgi:hypothetical protein